MFGIICISDARGYDFIFELNIFNNTNDAKVKCKHDYENFRASLIQLLGDDFKAIEFRLARIEVSMH